MIISLRTIENSVCGLCPKEGNDLQAKGMEAAIAAGSQGFGERNGGADLQPNTWGKRRKRRFRRAY